MQFICYFEGDPKIQLWLEKMLGVKLVMRELPSSNNSKEFTRLPAYVADILYLDKPDVIISGSVDGIHEKPLFSLEFASCTPQYEHALQRFARMTAAAVGGCPSAIIIAPKKRENAGGKRVYMRSRALSYGAVKLMDNYNLPAFIFDWPEEDGNLLTEKGSSYPPLNSPSMEELRSILLDASLAFENMDYLGSLWRCPSFRNRVDITRGEAYAAGHPTPSNPGGGDKKSKVKLDIVPTKSLLKQLLAKSSCFSDIESTMPNFIKKS